jgi:hypothetical protein
MRNTSLVWSADDAVREWNVPKATVYRKIKAAGLDPRAMTTLEVHRALFGDQHLERTKLVAAQRRMAESREKQLNGDLVPVSRLRQALIDPLVNLKRAIKDSHVTDGEYDTILTAIGLLATTLDEASKPELP